MNKNTIIKLLLVVILVQSVFVFAFNIKNNKCSETVEALDNKFKFETTQLFPELERHLDMISRVLSMYEEDMTITEKRLFDEAIRSNHFSLSYINNRINIVTKGPTSVWDLDAAIFYDNISTYNGVVEWILSGIIVEKEKIHEIAEISSQYAKEFRELRQSSSFDEFYTDEEIVKHLVEISKLLKDSISVYRR